MPSRAEMVEGESLGRFEGFNNEPDMESPYAYVYAGRQDRANEVVRGSESVLWGFTWWFSGE